MPKYCITESGYYVFGGYDENGNIVFVSTTTRKPVEAFREAKYKVGELDFRVIARCENIIKMRFIKKGLKEGLGNLLLENQQCA